MLCERYVSREQWLRVKICHSCKGVKSRLKSLQAWRRELKELVPELLRAHGYCRPEIVKRVLLY